MTAALDDVFTCGQHFGAGDHAAAVPSPVDHASGQSGGGTGDVPAGLGGAAVNAADGMPAPLASDLANSGGGGAASPSNPATANPPAVAAPTAGPAPAHGSPALAAPSVAAPPA